MKLMLELLERRDGLRGVLLHLGQYPQLVGFECPDVIGACALKLPGELLDAGT
jgi:hypothetical protein